MARNSFKHIACIALLAVVHGCTNQNQPDDPVSGNQSEEVYLRVSIIQDSGITRTQGDDVYTGTEAESMISNLHVYLAKPDFSEVVKLTELTTLRQTTKGYTSEPIKSETGNFLLYLVANATHADKTRFLPSESSLEEFVGEYAIGGKSEMDKFVTDNFVVMSNEQNHVADATEYTKGGIAISISDLNTKDNPAVVTVNLDRLTAKIVPSVSENLESAINGMTLISKQDEYYINNIEIEGAALLNCLKRFNLIQKWNKGRQYTPPSQDMELLTPNVESVHATDAYYNQLSEYVDTDEMAINPSAAFVKPGTPLFCMENNSVKYPSQVLETKYKNYTTAVLFRAKAHVHMKTEDSTQTTELTEHTFYRYNTLCFATLDALKQNNPELSHLNSPTELRRAGVQVYEDGYMYYIHWIKDTNYTDNGNNYYAVMRNTWYGLTVTNISGLGDDVPGYGPDEPIDPEKTNIIIEPVCEPWVYYKVIHGFE